MLVLHKSSLNLLQTAQLAVAAVVVAVEVAAAAAVAVAVEAVSSLVYRTFTLLK